MKIRSSGAWKQKKLLTATAYRRPSGVNEATVEEEAEGADPGGSRGGRIRVQGWTGIALGSDPAVGLGECACVPRPQIKTLTDWQDKDPRDEDKSGENRVLLAKASA